MTAQLGISIEPDAVVDQQMQALAHATGGAAGAAGTGPAEVGAVPQGAAADGASASSGALVKAGAINDPFVRVQMAMALAPRIG